MNNRTRNKELAQLFRKLGNMENVDSGVVIFIATKGPESGVRYSSVTLTAQEADYLEKGLACLWGFGQGERTKKF